MNAEESRPFIIRRKKTARKFHGGSWKIALADFMTALMAMFLVLWLLATSSTEELEGVAEYFSMPLMAAVTGGDRPTSASKPIPGGGDDPAYEVGEQARISLKQFNRPADIQRNFNDLRRRIQMRILEDPRLRELREQLRIYEIPEGLLIQVLDSDQNPMFQSGSAELAPQMVRLMRALTPILNSQPNKVSISGHTDSVLYAGDNPNYSNWELSTDRANATRRTMVDGGLAPKKVLRIVGMADLMPMPGTEASHPANRRIELIVLDESAMVNAGLDRLRPAFGLPAGAVPFD